MIYSQFRSSCILWNWISSENPRFYQPRGNGYCENDYIIKKKALAAEESMSYVMPEYQLNGKPLVYFAGFKNHIGFYATPSGHEAFNSKLSKYKRGKGSVQFPPVQVIPYELIGQMVEFRVAELQPEF